jgi:hypothetical protein
LPGGLASPSTAAPSTAAPAADAAAAAVKPVSRAAWAAQRLVAAKEVEAAAGAKEVEAGKAEDTYPMPLKPRTIAIAGKKKAGELYFQDELITDIAKDPNSSYRLYVRDIGEKNKKGVYIRDNTGKTEEVYIGGMGGKYIIKKYSPNSKTEPTWHLGLISSKTNLDDDDMLFLRWPAKDAPFPGLGTFEIKSTIDPTVAPTWTNAHSVKYAVLDPPLVPGTSGSTFFEVKRCDFTDLNGYYEKLDNSEYPNKYGKFVYRRVTTSTSDKIFYISQIIIHLFNEEDNVLEMIPDPYPRWAIQTDEQFARNQIKDGYTWDPVNKKYTKNIGHNYNPDDQKDCIIFNWSATAYFPIDCVGTVKTTVMADDQKSYNEVEIIGQWSDAKTNEPIRVNIGRVLTTSKEFKKYYDTRNTYFTTKYTAQNENETAEIEKYTRTPTGYTLAEINRVANLALAPAGGFGKKTKVNTQKKRLKIIKNTSIKNTSIKERNKLLHTIGQEVIKLKQKIKQATRLKNKLNRSYLTKKNAIKN